MREAGKITAEALLVARDMIRPGISTKAIDEKIQRFIEKCGATPSFLGYGGFPGSACISINDEVIHGIPTARRELCEGDIVSVVTPFLTSQGYDPEKDTHKGYHRTWDVRYKTSKEVSQARKHDKNVKDYEVREVTKISYLFGYDVKTYDLNEYTKEEALKHHLCLSDTLAHVSVVYDEWNGMYISGYGSFDDIEEMPDEVQDAFLFQDGRKHYFLLGVSSLGKIISDSKMPDYPDAKGQLAWNLNEIRYTVNSKYTKFAAGKYECDQKMTYYGKIPYIVIGDIMYFIPEAYSSYGLWATTKKAMEKMSYDPESEQNEDVIYPRSVFADGTLPLRYVEDML